MKELSKILFSFLLIFLISGCKQVSIISYDTSNVKPEGYTELINYYLPKSILKIKVPIQKKVSEKGLIHLMDDGETKNDLIKCFEENLNWKFVAANTEAFSLGDKIEFIPLTEPDSEKHYTIAFKNAKVLSQSLNIKLSKDGVIASGEFAQENKTFEFVSKGLEMGASLAGSFFGLGGGTVGKSYSCSSFTDNSDESAKIQSLLLEMNDISNSKAQLVTVQASGVSVEALKFRLEMMDKRIKEIEKIIMGKQKVTTYWLSFLYEPKKEEIVLLELDTLSGINIPNSKQDLSFINDNVVSSGKKLKIIAKTGSIFPADHAEFSQAMDSDQSNGDIEKFGFLRYNLPRKYTLQLLWDDKPLKSFANSEDKKGLDQYSMYFPQNGGVGILPNNFKDANIIYYEDIGAIKEIKLSKVATLDAKTIGTSFAAADSIVSLRSTIIAYNKAKKAESNTEDETEETQETVIRLIVEKEESVPGESSEENNEESEEN